ncbi:MAG: allophanate hydrolase [Pseudomonadota bacterium]
MSAVLNVSLHALRQQYLAGDLTPRTLIERLLPALEAEDSHHIWIHRLDRDALLAYADALQDKQPQDLPLYGIPFAIKDNIDLAGVPTTAACAAYAYTPDVSAFVVQRLIDAGAIPLGKTNLDQFATGLVGSRSPYGACRNAFDPDYISGGSSAGSAVAVALGLASFSLGTDTAGSGRIPAAFNNLIGIKPSLGLLSNRGMVPACRTLDCISIFALTAADAAEVLAVASCYDAADPYSKPQPKHPALPFGAEGFRFGVPMAAQLKFFGNTAGPERFEAAISALKVMGGTAVEIDFSPFIETAKLLYDGPWVAERYAAIADFIEQQPGALFPVTRQIIGRATEINAVAAFNAQYRLQALRRQAEAIWRDCDVLLTPTAGQLYTLAQVEADPIGLNSNLGYYTNFMNLLDMCALAVPAGFQADGLPFGVTLSAPAFNDRRLLDLSAQLHGHTSDQLGATGFSLPQDRVLASPDRHSIAVAVCGAHMSGLPLNHQLKTAGATLITCASTAPVYRLYALAGGPPYRPGLVRSEQGGAAIELELWRIPLATYGTFVAGIPSPLGIGSVILNDGSMVQGFVCEAIAATDAKEITHLGGWRAYLASMGL